MNVPVVTIGSSPHARGTGARRFCWYPSARFIPACAGNSGNILTLCFVKSLHPRMRGEQRDAARQHIRDIGSSPHARGTAASARAHMRKHRFIPACAGNRFPRIISPVPRSVHPRMRGEQWGQACHPAAARGSSPHARGTGSPRPRNMPSRRFIPACAGNRAPRRWSIDRRAVHPRMRGEQIDSTIYSHPPGGSSPHARGTGFCGVCH